MVVAQFHFGPFDGKRLLLPTEEPWPRFVIPAQWEPITIEVLYLFAGRMDDDCAYIYDSEWGDLFTY